MIYFPATNACRPGGVWSLGPFQRKQKKIIILKVWGKRDTFRFLSQLPALFLAWWIFFFLSYCLVPKGIIFRTLQLNPGYPQSRVSEVENKREWIEKENLYNYSLGSSAVLFPTTEPECKHPWWPRTREDDCSCQGALTASEPTCPHAEPQGEEGEEKKKKRTETSLLPPCC